MAVKTHTCIVSTLYATLNLEGLRVILQFTVVLWVCASYCRIGAATELFGTKIIGGEHFDFNNNYTFTVGLEYDPQPFSNAQLCTGSVLQEEWILTAASCFEERDDPRKVNVVYAKNIGPWKVPINAETIFKHPLYESGSAEYDIALVRLGRFLNTTTGQNRRTPAILFSGHINTLRGRTVCYLTGTGLDRPSDLDRANGPKRLGVDLKSLRKCAKLDGFNSSLHFCYKGDPSGGSCAGDVGRPNSSVLCGVDNLICRRSSLGDMCSDVTSLANAFEIQGDVGGPITCVVRGVDMQVGVNLGDRETLEGLSCASWAGLICRWASTWETDVTPLANVCELQGDVGGPITCVVGGVDMQVGVNLGDKCSDAITLASGLTETRNWILETIQEQSYPRCPAPPSIKRGFFTMLNATTWVLNCDTGYETDPPLAYLTCSHADGETSAGEWSSTSGMRCKRYRCDTSGQSFMAAFIYEDILTQQLPALSVQVEGLTEIHVQIPQIRFNGFYVFEHTSTITLSKAIFGENDPWTSQVLGISVTTDKPVKLLMYQQTQHGVYGAGTLVLPEQCASKRYTLYNAPGQPLDYKNVFDSNVLIALVDNTEVTAIDKSGEILYTVSLDRFEGFQSNARFADEMSFIANANVVVFAGVECGFGLCEYRLKQIPPDAFLGQTFIINNFGPFQQDTYGDIDTIAVIHPFPHDVDNVHTQWLNPNSSNSSTQSHESVSIASDFDQLLIQCSRPCMVFVMAEWSSTYAPIQKSATPVGMYEQEYNFVAGLDGGWVTLAIHSSFETTGLTLNDSPLSSYLDSLELTKKYESEIPGMGRYISLQFPVQPGKVKMAHTNSNAEFSLLYYGFYGGDVGYAFQLGRKI